MSDDVVDDAETVKNVGRSLAWIKKRNPELYRVLIQRAKEEGVKASDILIEALKFAYIDKERIFESMTARDFLVIIEKWNELQATMLRYMLDLVRVFWVEGFTKYNEIISAISETLKEEEEEKKKGKKEKKLDPETLMSMMMSIPQMMFQLMTTLPQALSSMAQMQTQQIPQQAPQQAEIKTQT
jgi:hypothetical protein